MDDEFAWVLMPAGHVPPRWAERARVVSLVPLMPEEASQLLATGSAEMTMTEEEERVARLAARGNSAHAIARDLHMTERSVYRRLARLRKRLGATTAAELASRLSKRGF